MMFYRFSDVTAAVASVVMLVGCAVSTTPAVARQRPQVRAIAACRPSRRVIVRTSQVVVWRTVFRTREGRRVSYYGCAVASGLTTRLISIHYGRVRNLKVAGHYVAFVWGGEGIEDLFVVDLARGMQVLHDGNCEPQAQKPCGEEPEVLQYLLSPNGWLVAVETLNEGRIRGQSLVVTLGQNRVTIDYGLHIERVSLAGTSLHWRSEGQQYSTPLDSGLIPAVTPPQGVVNTCDLLTSGDIEGGLVGPAVITPGGAAPKTTCSYRTKPAVTVGLNTALTPAELIAEENLTPINKTFTPGGPADFFAGNGNAFDGEIGRRDAQVETKSSIALQGSIELAVDVASPRLQDSAKNVKDEIKDAFLARRLLLHALTHLYALPIERTP